MLCAYPNDASFKYLCRPASYVIPGEVDLGQTSIIHFHKTSATNGTRESEILFEQCPTRQGAMGTAWRSLGIFLKRLATEPSFTVLSDDPEELQRWQRDCMSGLNRRAALANIAESVNLFSNTDKPSLDNWTNLFPFESFELGVPTEDCGAADGLYIAPLAVTLNCPDCPRTYGSGYDASSLGYSMVTGSTTVFRDLQPRKSHSKVLKRARFLFLPWEAIAPFINDGTDEDPNARRIIFDKQIHWPLALEALRLNHIIGAPENLVPVNTVPVTNPRQRIIQPKFNPRVEIEFA